MAFFSKEGRKFKAIGDRLVKELSPIRNTKKVVLVMAPYFYEGTVHEGYLQRVQAIDRELLDETFRVYVDFENKEPFIFDRVDENHLYITLPPKEVQRTKMLSRTLQQFDMVYIHSVMRLMPDIVGGSVIEMLRNSSLKCVWDVHGAVPEEFAFRDNYYEAQNAGEAEEFLINRADCVVCVNKATKDHLERKYDTKIKNCVILPIFSNLKKDDGVTDVKSDDNYPTVIYAGGLQPWQNIGLMKHVMLSTEHPCTYLFYTPEPEEFREGNFSPRAGIVRSSGFVPIDELNEIYAKAHFGFILREDTVLNNVACPTKLIEYIQKGIVPIVDTKRIGDFELMGLKCLFYKDFIEKLPSFEDYAAMAADNYNVLDLLNKYHDEGIAKLREVIYDSQSAF